MTLHQTLIIIVVVIPAQAEIQPFGHDLGPRFRGGDNEGQVDKKASQISNIFG